MNFFLTTLLLATTAIAAPRPAKGTHTGMPTGFPTEWPTALPSDFPTELLTAFPTGFPTNLPSGFPSDFSFPTAFPTNFPSDFSFPTGFPTAFPTKAGPGGASPTDMGKPKEKSSRFASRGNHKRHESGDGYPGKGNFTELPSFAHKGKGHRNHTKPGYEDN